MKPHREKKILPAEEIEWSVLLAGWPKEIPKPTKLKGVQKAGLAYEKRVGKYLKARFGKNAMIGPWFQFLDKNGKRYCQPDFLLTLDGQIYKIECKLSFRGRARDKLKKVYGPVVSAALNGSPPILIQVCRTLRRGLKTKTVPSIDEAISPGENRYRVLLLIK